MARRTGRNLKQERKQEKTAERKLTRREVENLKPVPQTMFLPDYPEQVKAIAARGLTDEEMANLFGISDHIMEAWKFQYPSFKRAIEEGRSQMDMDVIAALYTAATGLDPVRGGKRARIRKQKVVQTGEGDYDVVEIEEDLPPRVEAQRYWLNNRQPAYWGDKTQIGGDRSPGAKPIGVRDETKHEVIASILNFIRPKPDNPVE